MIDLCEGYSHLTQVRKLDSTKNKLLSVLSSDLHFVTDS
jgi:hypothetical protein